jgi:hypothetical protein
VNYGDPKFSLGDIVLFKQDHMGEMITDLGIVVSTPTLIFSHQWPTEDKKENFWSYDIKVMDNLFKMVPEAFLRSLKDEVEIKDSQRE